MSRVSYLQFSFRLQLEVGTRIQRPPEAAFSVICRVHRSLLLGACNQSMLLRICCRGHQGAHRWLSTEASILQMLAPVSIAALLADAKPSSASWCTKAMAAYF